MLLFICSFDPLFLTAEVLWFFFFLYHYSSWRRFNCGGKKKFHKKNGIENKKKSSDFLLCPTCYEPFVRFFLFSFLLRFFFTMYFKHPILLLHGIYLFMFASLFSFIFIFIFIFHNLLDEACCLLCRLYCFLISFFLFLFPFFWNCVFFFFLNFTPLPFAIYLCNLCLARPSFTNPFDICSLHANDKFSSKTSYHLHFGVWSDWKSIEYKYLRSISVSPGFCLCEIAKSGNRLAKWMENWSPMNF